MGSSSFSSDQSQDQNSMQITKLTRDDLLNNLEEKQKNPVLAKAIQNQLFEKGGGGFEHFKKECASVGYAELFSASNILELKIGNEEQAIEVIQYVLRCTSSQAKQILASYSKWPLNFIPDLLSQGLVEENPSIKIVPPANKGFVCNLVKLGDRFQLMISYGYLSIQSVSEPNVELGRMKGSIYVNYDLAQNDQGELGWRFNNIVTGNQDILNALQGKLLSEQDIKSKYPAEAQPKEPLPSRAQPQARPITIERGGQRTFKVDRSQFLALNAAKKKEIENERTRLAQQLNEVKEAYQAAMKANEEAKKELITMENELIRLSQQLKEYKEADELQANALGNAKLALTQKENDLVRLRFLLRQAASTNHNLALTNQKANQDLQQSADENRQLREALANVRAETEANAAAQQANMTEILKVKDGQIMRLSEQWAETQNENQDLNAQLTAAQQPTLEQPALQEPDSQKPAKKKAPWWAYAIVIGLIVAGLTALAFGATGLLGVVMLGKAAAIALTLNGALWATGGGFCAWLFNKGKADMFERDKKPEAASDHPVKVSSKPSKKAPKAKPELELEVRQQAAPGGPVSIINASSMYQPAPSSPKAVPPILEPQVNENDLVFRA